MKPEAFLPQNPNQAGPASVVPATPAAAWPTDEKRNVAWPPALSIAQRIEWLNDFLRNNRTAPRAQRLAFINQRHQLKLQLEAAELAANPAAQEDLRRIAERLACKAQSGFSAVEPPSMVEPAPQSNIVKLQRRKPKAWPGYGSSPQQEALTAVSSQGFLLIVQLHENSPARTIADGAAAYCLQR